MLPNNNQIRYLLLLEFSRKKELSRKEAFDLLSKTFNLAEKELTTKTREEHKTSFKSTLEWQFTALRTMGFIEFGGKTSKITKTGMNVANLLKVQH